MDVRPAGRMGRGLFAKAPIGTGAHLCSYDGRMYASRSALVASRVKRGLAPSDAIMRLPDGRHIGMQPHSFSSQARA